VPSGGESNPLLLQVRWNTREIVVNPAPGLDVSDPVLFEILPASK